MFRRQASDHRYLALHPLDSRQSGRRFQHRDMTEQSEAVSLCKGDGGLLLAVATISWWW
jgi:hypothetical protein